MKILALEFSASLRSVAIAGSDADVVMVQERTERERGPFALLRDCLTRAGVGSEGVDVLAIGVGPGSYTGIRVAIAVAQGWQIARRIPVIGLSSAECMARQAAATGLRGIVNVVVDAQRGEYCLARFQVTPQQVVLAAPCRLVRPAELTGLADAGEPVLGPDPIPGCSAWQRCLPEAAMLARMAQGRTDFVDPSTLEPVHLRDTQFVKAPPPRPVPPRSA